MKTIPLTKGKSAIVDDEDFAALSKHKWCLNNKGYAVRGSGRATGHKTIFMHRVLCATPQGMATDHINGNKLDNRRENLRACTNAENLANRGVPKNNRTGFKGVSFKKALGKYCARIKINYSEKHLGVFNTAEEAHAAYCAAAASIQGDFARKQ